MNYKLHFFPNPQISLHIQREFHCNNLPIQQLSLLFSCSETAHFWKERQFFVVGNYRIHFKILLLTWKALHDMAPAYISELINLHNPSRQLRSSHKNLLSVPRTFSSHGDRAFYSCAPKLWNSLPADLHFCSSLDIFKKTLKTHLFKIAYDST